MYKADIGSTTHREGQSMSDDIWWPWPPTEYSTQKGEFERELSDQMRRMIADLDRIFPLLMAPSLPFL